MAKNSPVFWTDAELRAVREEGVRLIHAGNFTSEISAFRAAQRVLPQARRREVSTIAKVPWFSSALKAAQRSQNEPQSCDQQFIAISATNTEAPKNATQAESSNASKKLRVHWNSDEQRALCKEAARLLMHLEAGSPRDALMKAQAIVLRPERQRTIFAMTSVADWYSDGLLAARQALEREAERQAEAAQDQSAVAPALTEQSTAPTIAPTEVAPVPTAVALAPSTPLTSVLGRPWAALREHLVLEVASIVTEGIMRGLESVKLAPKNDEQEQSPVPHVPFLANAHPKERPPSVLVVGLRGGQVPQIEADFGSRLNLRFCGADKSKDHLRAMAEQADTTVAVVDFLSHSHTDIIKARSKHYIESAGGMTALRQQLARLAEHHVNGRAQA